MSTASALSAPHFYCSSTLTVSFILHSGDCTSIAYSWMYAPIIEIFLQSCVFWKLLMLMPVAVSIELIFNLNFWRLSDLKLRLKLR